jgi:hypothetical protein
MKKGLFCEYKTALLSCRPSEHFLQKRGNAHCEKKSTVGQNILDPSDNGSKIATIVTAVDSLKLIACVLFTTIF